MGLPGYFLERVGPALAALLDAVAVGAIQGDISGDDIRYAIVLVCGPTADRSLTYSQRMVGLRRRVTVPTVGDVSFSDGQLRRSSSS